MATSAMSIHTPSGNRNAESVNTHIKIHPVAILQSIRLRSLFSRKSRLHAKIWVLNWFEPIKKTDFSSAENIDVVGKYLKINSVTIQLFWSVRLKKKTRMKLSARRVPRVCFDFWMFLDALWHWVASKSGLPVLLLSDETVSDKA